MCALRNQTFSDLEPTGSTDFLRVHIFPARLDARTHAVVLHATIIRTKLLKSYLYPSVVSETRRTSFGGRYRAAASLYSRAAASLS